MAKEGHRRVAQASEKREGRSPPGVLRRRTASFGTWLASSPCSACRSLPGPRHREEGVRCWYTS